MTLNSRMVKISELISPSFHNEWKSVFKYEFTEYDETGGRGSTKSSFISLVIVHGMMLDRQNGEITHAVVLRQYQKDLRESVFEQIGWAIDRLHVSHLWKKSLNPMRWTYMSNKQYYQDIRFRGCDDPQKVKSIKFQFGYPKYLWFEEKDQFRSSSDINSIKLSIARKNDDGEDRPLLVFSSYNPPKNPAHWINIDAKRKKPYRHQCHTDYTMIPQEWLTKAFLEEAENMKLTNPNEYSHVFLGKVTGVDGLAYPMFNIDRHTMPLQEALSPNGGLKILTQFERITRIICGEDVGVVKDATTLIPMCCTTAGRIIALPTFYYDPCYGSHVPLSPSKQVKLMENWIRCWGMFLFGYDLTNLVLIVGDSAGQQQIQEFNDITNYRAIPVPSKDKIRDWKRHQDILSVPNMFLLLNAGYIDPCSVTYEEGQIFYTKIDENDMYIQEIVSLAVEEEKDRPMDGNDHVIDGANYGFNIITTTNIAEDY